MTEDSSFDLLEERRSRLGQEEPGATNPRRSLVWGALVASAMVGATGVGWAVVASMQRSALTELERLTPVQARYDQMKSQIIIERKKTGELEKQNNKLAKALVAVGSGSALMEELRRRTPRGLQFSEVIQEGNSLRLRGQAKDPGAFARINALQLQLQRSRLFNANQVSLIQARRDNGKETNPPAANASSKPVQFELTAAFSQSGINGDLTNLRDLGATGMAERLRMLQRQGVMP
jgi:type IV pilus assembly protein PilN